MPMTLELEKEKLRGLKEQLHLAEAEQRTVKQQVNALLESGTYHPAPDQQKLNLLRMAIAEQERKISHLRWEQQQQQMREQQQQRTKEKNDLADRVLSFLDGQPKTAILGVLQDEIRKWKNKPS